MTIVWQKPMACLRWCWSTRMATSVRWLIWRVNIICWKTLTPNMCRQIWMRPTTTRGRASSWRTLMMRPKAKKTKRWMLKSAWCWKHRTVCSASRSMCTTIRIVGVRTSLCCTIRWIAGLSARPLAANGWLNWTIRSTGNRRAPARDVSANGWKTFRTGTWAVVATGERRCLSGVPKTGRKKSASVRLKNCTMKLRNP